MKRLVLKRLSASDLTLFEYHFRNSASKQKAINLDKSVFVDSLYPHLANRSDVTKDKIPVDLKIYGPSTSGAQTVRRKILKEAKNWRLNGELITAPDTEPNRYNQLKKDDLAVMEFEGETTPDAVRIHLVSQDQDNVLHRELNKKYNTEFTGRKAMCSIEHDDLDLLLESISLEPEHSLFDLTTSRDLGDIAQGGEEGVRNFLRKRKSARGVSREELETARRSAEGIGRVGEEILKNWLEKQPEDFQWDADINAVCPFDFTLLDNGQPIRRIDAKSTKGPYSNAIHISMGELEEMASGGVPYDIYRLYSMTDDGAKLRICRDMKDFAEKILISLDHLPNGIRVDSVSVKTDTLPAGKEIHIDLFDE